MIFEIRKIEKCSIVRVNTTRLDANNAFDLRSRIVVVNNDGEKNIVLDLSYVTYCDSSGLRAVLIANRICEDALGTFILCGLQPDVEKLIKISMLHTVLLITKTEEEALELIEKKESF